MTTLDDLAVRWGTDKGSRPARGLAAKNYTVAYQNLLAGREGDLLRVLEIGVWQGASLRMWHDHLPHAHIVGVDVNPRVRRLTRPGAILHGCPRVELAVGSQSDPDLLADLVDRGPWDAIIDDGSHRAADVAASLAGLLSSVADDGWYAIEDLTADDHATKIATITAAAEFENRAVIWPQGETGRLAVIV